MTTFFDAEIRGKFVARLQYQSATPSPAGRLLQSATPSPAGATASSAARSAGYRRKVGKVPQGRLYVLRGHGFSRAARAQ